MLPTSGIISQIVRHASNDHGLRAPLSRPTDFAPLGVVPDSDRYRKLMQKQTRLMVCVDFCLFVSCLLIAFFFQTNDGKYVWQKTTLDVTLARTANALALVAVGYIGYTLYTMAFPPKKE